MAANQQVTCLTDGGAMSESVPSSTPSRAPDRTGSKHQLRRVDGPDWQGPAGEIASEAARQLERPQAVPLHGNIFRALQVVGDLEIGLDLDDAGAAQAKLVKAVAEFAAYCPPDTDPSQHHYPKDKDII